VHAPQYQETLFSHLFPGSTASLSAYIPVFQCLDQFLKLSPPQKQRTILRSDSGFGSDLNLDYALDEDWQILSKGYAARRTGAIARQTVNANWLEIGKNRWVTRAIGGPTYVRPVQYLLLRWLTESGETKHSTVVCSISEWSWDQVIQFYDDRAACETEIQADKGGLKICKRRKHHLAAQEALILLTDLTHNLLAWANQWMQMPVSFSQYRTTRTVEDVLAVPGRLKFDEDDQLEEVQLNELYPHVDQIADGLRHLLEHFDLH
jgi:hypothetical protein